jgi:hypothetical protein
MKWNDIHTILLREMNKPVKIVKSCFYYIPVPVQQDTTIIVTNSRICLNWAGLNNITIDENENSSWYQASKGSSSSRVTGLSIYNSREVIYPSSTYNLPRIFNETSE